MADEDWDVRERRFYEELNKAGSAFGYWLLFGALAGLLAACLLSW